MFPRENKLILTKTQAVSLLLQIKEGDSQLDLFKSVDSGNKLFNKTVDELEVMIQKHLGEKIYAVVDDPEKTPSNKM